MITASTGQFKDFAGNISDIGPLYPFVGGEVLFFLIGLALWIVWHIVQINRENKTYDDEVKRFGDKNTLKKIISREDPWHP